MEISQKMQRKLNEGREYRKMCLEARTDDENYMVSGYATTFNEPYVLYQLEDGRSVKEQVDPNAFKDTDMSDVIMQYDHEGRVFARLSNETLKLDVDDHGLLINAYLGGTEMGRNLYEEIKGGYTNKMSFGFTVADDDFAEEKDGYLRTIRSIGKLYDVSAVSIPANDFTEISARNQLDGEIEKIEQERVRLEEERRVLDEQRENLLNKLKGLKGE